MKIQNKCLTTALLVTAAAFPISATATSITGSLYFSGDVTITTDVNTGAGTLTFDDVTGETYTFTIDAGSGDLATLTGGGNEATIGTTTAPVNTVIDIPDFLTFVNDPGLTFTLTYVYGGIDPTSACVASQTGFNLGATCSPPGTPYNLQDIGSTNPTPPATPQYISSASFVVAGDLVEGGTDTPATISFSSTDVAESFEQILYDQQHGTPDTITYGAQLNAGAAMVPEPATSSLMLGAGLVLVGSMFRNRNRRTR